MGPERRVGLVHALADRCSHRGGPLSDGEVVGGPDTIAQPTYEVRLDGDDVLVRRSEKRTLRANPV